MEEVKIPVIDLLRSPAENEKLLEACQGTGCFRVANHGIPAELQAEMKAAVRSLFDLPHDVKCRTADVTPGRGYNQRTEETRLFEAFGLYDAASPADVDRFCSQLQASPETRYPATFITYFSI